MNAFNTAVSEEHLSNLRDLIKSPVTQHVRAPDLSEIMVTWVWTMASNMATGERSALRYITQVFNRRAGIILKTNYKHWRRLFNERLNKFENCDMKISKNFNCREIVISMKSDLTLRSQRLYIYCPNIKIYQNIINIYDEINAPRMKSVMLQSTNMEAVMFMWSRSMYMCF